MGVPVFLQVVLTLTKSLDEVGGEGNHSHDGSEVVIHHGAVGSGVVAGPDEEQGEETHHHYVHPEGGLTVRITSHC
jgi:hypothetical protein